MAGEEARSGVVEFSATVALVLPLFAFGVDARDSQGV